MVGDSIYDGGGMAGPIDASREAATAAAEARRTRGEMESLTRRMDRLALMTEALWQLLRERFGLSEDELRQVAYDLDMSDGVLDGRVRRMAVVCPQCGRVVGKGHPQCLYCGAEIERTPFSDV